MAFAQSKQADQRRLKEYSGWKIQGPGDEACRRDHHRKNWLLHTVSFHPLPVEGRLGGKSQISPKVADWGRTSIHSFFPWARIVFPETSLGASGARTVFLGKNYPGHVPHGALRRILDGIARALWRILRDRLRNGPGPSSLFGSSGLAIVDSIARGHRGY